MPFLLAEILNFQGSTHHIGVGSFSQLLNKLISKEICGKFQAYKINDRIEVLFLIIYSFVIMVTIQPLVISRLFRLG